MSARDATRTVDRLARRIVRRHRSVSLCAIGIVAFSVGVAAMLTTRATTPLVDDAKVTATRWGTANAVVFSDAGQSMDYPGRRPVQPGSCCSTTVESIGQLQAESNFPAGTPSLPIESFSVVMSRNGAEDRGVAVPVVQAEFTSPLARGMSRVVAGRLPRAPGEVAVVRPLDAADPTDPTDPADPANRSGSEPPTATEGDDVELSDVTDGRIGSEFDALVPATRLRVVGEVVAPIAAQLAQRGGALLIAAAGTFPTRTDPAWASWPAGDQSWRALNFAAIDSSVEWTLTTRWGAWRDDSGALAAPVVERPEPSAGSWPMAVVSVMWALAVAAAVASALLGRHGRDLAQVQLAGGSAYVVSRLGSRVMGRFVWIGTLIGSAVGLLVGLAQVDAVDPLVAADRRWLAPALAVAGVAVVTVFLSVSLLGARHGAATSASTRELLSGSPAPRRRDVAPTPKVVRALFWVGCVVPVLVFAVVPVSSSGWLRHGASLAVPCTLVAISAVAVVGARLAVSRAGRRVGTIGRPAMVRLAGRDLVASSGATTGPWLAVSLAVLIVLFSVTAWESDADRDQRLANDVLAQQQTVSNLATAPADAWAIRQVLASPRDLAVRPGGVESYTPADLQARVFAAGFDFARLAGDARLCLTNLNEVTPPPSLSGPCVPTAAPVVIADAAIDRLPVDIADRIRGGQPVAWYSAALRALPEGLTWQPRTDVAPSTITLWPAEDLDALNRSIATSASNPLLTVAGSTPIVLISSSMATTLGLDRGAVASFGVDPSHRDAGEVARMADTVDTDGVTVVDGYWPRSGAMDGGSAPTPHPSGWLLGGLGALVAGSALAGILLGRWQRRQELAVIEMQGASRVMMAGACALHALAVTAATTLPIAFGLWCAGLLMQVSPGVLGSSTLFVAWTPLLMMSVVVPAAAGAIAWCAVGARPVPGAAGDREMISP